MSAFESERRQFTRIRKAIEVHYKFLSVDEKHADLERIWEGTSTNLSSGGLLLTGVIPQLDWLPMLLSGRMQIGVNLILPTSDAPIKALCRVAWIEGFEENTKTASMGMVFQEIASDHLESVVHYIIRTQIPG